MEFFVGPLGVSIVSHWVLEYENWDIHPAIFDFSLKTLTTEQFCSGQEASLKW